MTPAEEQYQSRPEPTTQQPHQSSTNKVRASQHAHASEVFTDSYTRCSGSQSSVQPPASTHKKINHSSEQTHNWAYTIISTHRASTDQQQRIWGAELMRKHRASGTPAKTRYSGHQNSRLMRSRSK